MGLLSSSRSKQETINNTESTEVVSSQGDNRVTDSGNIGGNINLGQTSGNVSLVQTDYGAIDQASNVSLAALDFGGDAIEGVQGIATESLINQRELAEQSIDTVADNFKFWNQQTTQNIDSALAFAAKANTSENAQLLEQGVKFLSVTALIIGGVVVAGSYLKGRR